MKNQDLYKKQSDDIWEIANLLRGPYRPPQEEIRKFYKNGDKFLLNFKNHIKSKVGEAFYPLIDYKLVQIDGKNVMRVSCGMANTPCFLEDTEFYVRSGPSTDMLAGKKQHEYIKERF